MSITIDQENYEYVLSITGYPFIDPTELSLPYDESTVKQYCISPAMQEYFKWFPIKEEESIAVSNGSRGTKAYPDSYVFSLNHSAFTSTAHSQGDIVSQLGNPWISSRSYQSSIGSQLGSRFDYGYASTSQITRLSADAQNNGNKVFRVVPNDFTRSVEYYSSMSGYIELVWARWSEDFNDIPWNKRKEVLELSQAELLLWTARVLEKTNPELPSDLNTDDMRTEGEDIKEKIMTKWKSYTKAVNLR